jgi:hypothetical protein
MQRDRQWCAMQFVSVNMIDLPNDDGYFVGVIDVIDDNGHSIRLTKTYQITTIGMFDVN